MNLARCTNNPCILIADDDEDDHLLIASAFRDTGLDVPVKTVMDGQELMDYLLCRGKYEGSHCELPQLILLDLNMPKKDGRQALLEIKQNPKLCVIPVIIYSTSNDPGDVNFSYEAGANSFVTKPSSYEELKKFAHLIKDYWFSTALTAKIL